MPRHRKYHPPLRLPPRSVPAVRPYNPSPGSAGPWYLLRPQRTPQAPIPPQRMPQLHRDLPSKYFLQVPHKARSHSSHRRLRSLLLSRLFRIRPLPRPFRFHSPALPGRFQVLPLHRLSGLHSLLRRSVLHPLLRNSGLHSLLRRSVLHSLLRPDSPLLPLRKSRFHPSLQLLQQEQWIRPPKQPPGSDRSWVPRPLPESDPLPGGWQEAVLPQKSIWRLLPHSLPVT